MIKLNKLPEPHVLRDNKNQWTEEYKAAKAATPLNATDINEKKNRYRHPDIKALLIMETNEKCAYCESKMRHVYPGDIEHIKPKSDFEDDIFEWGNLTLSCSECNRRKLNNYDEEAGIINPYNDDPEEHLRAVGATIMPKPGDVIGKIAYELFQLNRLELLERRVDKLEQLQRLIDNYVTETNPLYKKLLRKNIDREANGQTEYAMIARAYIKTCLRSDGIPRA